MPINQTTVLPSPFQEELKQTADHLATVLPPAVNQTIDRGIERVSASGIARRSLQPGDEAPDFTLPDTIGQPVTLSELLKKGPVVLTFYRGNWCPFCSVQLRAYQRALPYFKLYDATLVAVSPQTPNNSERTAADKELQFPVLSDVGNLVAQQYGLAYAVGDEVYSALKSVGIDLETYNDNATGELPLTSTFVIGTDGVVAWAETDPNFKLRPDPEAILNALDELDSDA